MDIAVQDKKIAARERIKDLIHAPKLARMVDIINDEPIDVKRGLIQHIKK